MNTLHSPSGQTIYFRGPALEEGKLPAFFYFALSGEDSLNLDPFNQPVVSLDTFPLRVFSMTIPGHGEGLKNTEAMGYWAREIENGNDPLTPFFEQCQESVEFLIQHEIVDEKQMAVGGLSRGGYIALHLASRISAFHTVLGYAPLTTMRTIGEFEQILHHEMIQSLEIDRNPLIGKRIRFYIGNRDLRVSTDACYQFVRELTDLSYDHQVRSPEIELLISPSIGHKGHGTPPQIFKAGAEWIASLLTSNSL